jgi:hypothetical protein
MENRSGEYKVLVGRPEGRDHLEDMGRDGRAISKWIFKKYDGDMDWIDLAQDRDRCRALVNAIVNLRVP